VRTLREKLDVWTDPQLPNVYMFSGGGYQIRGTCLITFDPTETQQGVDLGSPDGRLHVRVDSPYTMETHGAVPLSLCLQALRETLNW